MLGWVVGGGTRVGQSTKAAEGSPFHPPSLADSVRLVSSIAGCALPFSAQESFPVPAPPVLEPVECTLYPGADTPKFRFRDPDDQGWQVSLISLVSQTLQRSASKAMRQKIGSPELLTSWWPPPAAATRNHPAKVSPSLCFSLAGFRLGKALKF